MKKLLAILLAGILMISLVACGKKKPNQPGNSGTPGAGGAGELKTSLFTLSYDDGVWTVLEEDLTDEEEYCFAKLQVPDPEDSEYYLIDAEIEVSLEEPYDFRETLVSYGFVQYEYKVNNAYDTVTIGGVDLLKYEDGDEKLVYFNRVEGAGATISIEFDAQDISDSRLEELLKGLNFTLTDEGNTDGPWEWEGEPFSTEDHTVTAGGFTLTSKFIPFEASLCTFETFDHSVAVVGNKVYLLSEGKLIECHYDGTVLAFMQAYALPETGYEYISATADGTLWLSGSMNDVLCMKDGAVVSKVVDLDNFVMAPSGTWGISYFVSNECTLLNYTGEAFTSSPIVFAEVDTIMHLNVDENNIYVCGSAADDSGHKVFVYNKEGALQATLCDAEGEGLGSVTFVAKTANGYIGFDGNMRDVILWGNDGTFLAETSDGDLFGTSYPWFCSSAVCSDGSILTIMTEEREDRSATELIVFQVNGF